MFVGYQITMTTVLCQSPWQILALDTPLTGAGKTEYNRFPTFSQPNKLGSFQSPTQPQPHPQHRSLQKQLILRRLSLVHETRKHRNEATCFLHCQLQLFETDMQSACTVLHHCQQRKTTYLEAATSHTLQLMDVILRHVFYNQLEKYGVSVPCFKLWRADTKLSP